MGDIVDFLFPSKRKRDTQLLDTQNTLRIIDQREIASVRDELECIKQLISTRNAKPRVEYKGLERVVQTMKKKCMYQSFIDYFREQMQQVLTIQELNDVHYMHQRARRFIQEKIKFATSKNIRTKQRIILFIGPSGVGKTLTIFKMAEWLSSKEKKNRSNIRIASLDNETIAMDAYLKIMQKYMEFETCLLNTCEDLVKYARKGARPDILLVDTTSKNPKNKEDLVNFSQEILPIRDKGDTLLVIPANMSRDDLENTVNVYKIFQYSGVIITKMDEVEHQSRILSLCIECGIPIVGVCDGTDIGSYSDATMEGIMNYFNDML